MSTTAASDRIDNTLLREAFQRSGRSSSSVARAVWGKTGKWSRGDNSLLDRALGIRPDQSRGYKSYRQTIPGDLAMKIAEEIGVDARDIGL